MNNLSLANRLKARLTRAERLTNATALLQRMLANRTASEAPFTPGTSADAPGRGAPKAFGTDFSKEALDWTKGTAQPAMPEALRDFLDRIGQLGSTSGLPPGLDGLVGSVPTHAPAPLPEARALRPSPTPTRPEAGLTSSTSRAATADNRCLLS
jgi:hypothetical protein